MIHMFLVVRVYLGRQAGKGRKRSFWSFTHKAECIYVCMSFGGVLIVDYILACQSAGQTESHEYRRG